MSPHDPEADAPRASLRWTVHPAGRSPARALLVGGLILLTSLLAGSFARSNLLAVLALVFLALSLRSFFLPRTYELDDTGARESGPLCSPRALGWERVRQVRAARFGVWLAERHTESRMLPARGLFLRTEGNREDVLAAARQRVEAR